MGSTTSFSPSPYTKNLVVHRGFHRTGKEDSKRPKENTIEACVNAWRRGFVFCEVDVCLSAGNTFYLSHDGLVDLPEGRVPIASLLDNKIGLSKEPPQELNHLFYEINFDFLILDLKCDAKDVSNYATCLAKLLVKNGKVNKYIHMVMSTNPELMVVLSRLLPENVKRVIVLEEKIVSWLDTETLADIFSTFNVHGFYLEFCENMLDPAFANAMKSLTSKYCIGIWNSMDQMDGLQTYKTLGMLGVRYINTDLPKKLFNN